MRAVYRRSRIAKQLWKTTALTTLALGLSGVAAYGDDAGLWQPQIRAIVGADNNGGNAALEGFIPIKQSAESVLFLDVRAKHDFKDASGQDIGLGIRRIVNPDLMLGGYAYINLENYNSTQFTAATLGVEAITPNFDAHVNVFVPIKGDSTDHSVSSSLSMVSNQLIEQISVLDHRDYAAWGIEGEVGAQVPINLPDKHSLRLDIGGYHFEDPHGDDGSVTGAKAGFEYTIGDVFGSGTELVFAGEVRNDNRDDTQFAGSVRLNIPFNPGHSSDTTAAIGTEPVYPVSEGLRKRVNERVRGDIGVRVQSQDKIGGSTTRVAINAATNAAFGKFYFADGGLAGAGTQADPTTLDDAVTKAGNGGFVVALGGNGNIQTAGTTLASGQTLIGGGESVTAKLSGGGTATFNLGGSDGTIQGTNVANNVITLGNGNTLNGITITITGGADGIFGNNVTGTTLTNVTVTGAGGNGAEFTGNSTNVKASGFTATGNGLDGLHIEDNGTYNFTGTTLLSGNLDDGLDITGQGTYSFATVNALNNIDRGITVQGTSSGGSFTTTGGTVSGNGGVGVYIDPITAHVVLDSITQTGGTSGVVLDHVSGSFTVNGATTISNTTGPAIAISDSPAAIRFGDIAITNPGADGMSFSGVNAAVVAGNIVISGLGLGHTGLDFSGSQTTFTALSANISGAGAGSIGIDLADTTGDAAITITNGGSISGVDTGVRLGISGSLAHSANAEFTFGGGSIAGVTASLDARGLNQTLGHYAFGSTTFSGPQLFDQQNVIFVGGVGSSGDGSSTSSLLAINLADANTASDAIFVLVNEGSAIDANGGFSLSDGQTLASFGNGRSFSLGGVPVNVTGANIEHDQVVSDPGGGAATLTNSGAGAVVTAANGNSLLDFDISGGSAEGINATGITGLTIQGVTVSGGTIGLLLDDVAGTVSVKDLDIQNPSQTGIALVGSSATVNFTGNTTIAGATNVALFANNFDGTATFDDLDITGGGIGVGVVGGSSGTLTFGSGSSIAGTTSNAVSITNSTPNFTYNGTINQTAASAVKISNMTGGSATFGGKITASTGAANAIDLTGNTGGTINFTGGLDLTTDGGFGFSAINGGTLNVIGTNTIATGAGSTEKGIQLGGAGGLTIGASGVTFASVTVDGSGGAVPTGILIENTSGGNVTFGAVNVSRVNGDAIRLSNIASGTYTFNGTTTIDTVGGPGPGFVVQNSAATVSVNNLVTTGVSGADVSLTNNTGTIGIGGTITNSGSGDGVVVSGGSAAITVSANISSSATAGTAVKVDGITGGSAAFTGSVTATGTGNLFNIGSTTAPTGGTISFTGSALTATGGGGVTAGLAGTATLNVTAPVSITNATGNGLSVSNVASGASATFGAVTVTGATGNGIDIGSNAGPVTFGATTVTMGAAANTAGINFSGTNANVSFGTTNVTLGAGANQTGIDFSGSSTAAAFGLTTITGNGDLTSRGIDLSSTTGNKTITFLRGSSITNVGVGVDLSSGGTTATSANANFTFGDGTSADGLQSSISAAAGGYTVNTIGLDPTLGNYNFNDVFFTGSAHLASAAGGVIMVSQSGGVIAAGTDGLSAAVTTISVAQADALLGTQTFAFVGTVDLSGTPFTLDSGQSITGFGNGNSILTSGTVQPVNVQGNLGATGGNVTGDEGVVKSTGSDTLHLLGSNQVRNTAFDFTGGSGSVFTVDQSAGGFNNAGGIFIDGVTVSNVAAGQTAIKIIGVDTNVSITNNNINVAGTLLDANGGAGDITLTRGNLPNSGPAGTLTGGGISIANRTGGTVDFTDKVTVNGNGVSLTNNTGATITFADLDVSTSGATAFTATGGGTVNVTTGTIANTNGQAVALDGITAGINFASTNATFSAGTGIDLQNLAGTAAFGTGMLSNTGSGMAFNVGSTSAGGGGNATISYGGTIASNGTGAAVSIQSMIGGSVTLSGNLTDSLAAAGGNIFVAGNDFTTVTFSGTTKQISSGAADGVNLGLPGGWPSGTPTPSTNSAINFTNGGLDITTTSGAGFIAIGDLGSSSFTVTGSGNKINSGGDGLLAVGAVVGAGGVTFDSISAVSTSALGGGAGVLLSAMTLAGDVNIGGLKDTGYTGASLSGLSGAGVVNFTGTTDLDVSNNGFQISGQVGTINIANVAGSTLTIDGGQVGITQFDLQTGTVNVGGNGGIASIGATTSTIGSAIALSGGNDLVHATLNYNGSIKVDTGSVLQAGGGDWTHLNLSGSVVSTTAISGLGAAAFIFSGNAEGVYNISSTIDHTGTAVGVLFDGSSEGTVAFSGTSKIFNTSSGANDAIVKAPSIGPTQGTGTLNFTGGNLEITTASGTGFKASTFGAGSVSVSGTGNTITTTTGTALNLDGASVGAGGITFDSISANGAATGVSLNNISGGGIGLGVVDLQGITAHGIDISGTLGSSISATSIDIGLNATNAVGLDLNGALLGASTITAGDFDVDGGSFAGTLGIDMAGTTGTGTIQLGDAVNNNPAGQTSTIKNVGYGVQFSSTTNAKLVFGDGAGPAESSIATTGGQVIHATDSLPTNGDYNFNDVNFTGDTSNLSSISVYYVTSGGTGDGSLANPGSYAGAQASTANVVVLIDQNVNGAQETIDLGGTSFQLDDGQVLLAFKSGDAAVDVSQLGIDSSSGASAAFHFTTVQNTPIVSAPGGIDTLRPILQSNTAGSVVDLATTGTGTLTGGMANLIIRNTGTGTGVAVNAAAASSFFLSNNDIAAGGRALDFSTTGAPANTLLLSIDANTLQSTGSALAASFAGQNISATDNSIAIRSFAGNTVIGGTGGGINFTNVRFDADGVGGTVSAGTLTVGNPGARVQVDGLSFINTSGTLDLGTLNLANNGGTGVLVDTKGANTTFTLNNSGGTVDTTNGAAFNLDPLTVDMTFGTVTATGGASGIIFDGVAGTFTVTGTTTITGTSGAGVSAINTNTGTFNFNTLTVNNAATAGGGIGWASGTLNVSGLANIDTTSGAGLSQTAGTTAFTGGLTVDTSSGDGFFVSTGGAVTVTGSANTVTTATGRVVSMQTATIGAGGVTFQTLKSTGTVSSGAGIQLSNVSGGVFNGGDVSIAGSSNNAITVQNGTSSTVNFNSAVVSNATFNGIDINTGVTGTVTFGTVTIDNTGASGVRLLNTSGSVNINGGSIGATDDPAGIGVEVSGGAATLNVAASVTKTSAGKIVDISGATGGTVTLSGNLSATGGFDNGINVQSNTGGTFNFTGATKTLTTGANTAVNLATNTGAAINFTGGGLAITTTSGAGFSATGGGTVSVGTGANANTISTGTGVPVNMNGVAVAAGGVNFASTSNGAGGTSGVVLTNVTGAGTVNLGTGTLVGGSAAAISISGGSVNLTYAGNISQATAAQALLSVVGGHTGTLTFNSGTLSATNGTGLQFDNADGTYNFNGTTTLNGGDAGVDIVNGSAGNFGFGAGTSITNPTGVGFNVNGGTGNITYAGTISKSNNSSNIVSIQSHTGGTTAFSGTISATGSSGGIALSGNTGATINFSNTLTLTGSNTIGFSATGGGTISATGTGSVISSGTATALNVANTSIGSGNLVFQSISTNGATNGIVLNNTGLAAGNGGLTVTGTGTTSGSGGTIQNAVQGALFTSTKNLSLSNMNFTNANSGNGTVNNIDDPTFNSAAQAAINMSGVATATFTNLNVVGNGGAGGAQVGINGQNVSNLTLANSTVTGFGDAAGEGNVKLWNLSGTSAITNSTFGFVPGDTTGGENLVEVRNNTGTLTLNISGSTFQNTRDSTSGSGGFAITTVGSAVATVNVSNSTFTNLKTSGVEAFARDTSTLNVNITDGGTAGNGNTFTTGGTTEAFTGRAIGLNAEDTAQLNFNINRNKKIYGFGGPVINIYAQDNASIQGRINNNADIENNATGTNFAGSPIYIHPQDNATGVVEVIGNTIINNGQDAAISANVEGDGISKFNASLDLTIQNNNITLAGRNLNANSFNNAILLSSGASDNDATILTVNLQNNVIAPASINGTTGNVGLAIENTGGVNSHLYMEGFTTDPTTTWNNAGNTPVGSVIELDNIAPLPSAIPVGHNGGHTKTPTNPNQ
ncbi:hypothetical protein [Mesorhizobium erdmanii]|uniref:hypothetical protein n=1 Tax=Mesorhizobium erdmanii TaxID=1777866 RepID=UPI0007ED2948|nr:MULTISPECIES: hypothetical protein [Mesorhizobium]OBQ63353.1 hypothetical protein A8146_12865 [Mesorhizobium loti]